MAKRICIVDGHPDPDPKRLVHVLCDAYVTGAQTRGHDIERIDVCNMEISPLRSAEEFSTNPDRAICKNRKKIANADHLVVAFPLWLGGMPALTRAFFEQAARDSFFIQTSDETSKWPAKMMRGKSARIIVTMGMPAFAYKTIMRTAALKALEKGMLGISGFKPIKHTIFGGVGSVDAKTIANWIDEVTALGRIAG